MNTTKPSCFMPLGRNKGECSKMKRETVGAKMVEEMREFVRGMVGMRKRERTQRPWQSSVENGTCSGHHIKGPVLFGCSDTGACVRMSLILHLQFYILIYKSEVSQPWRQDPTQNHMVFRQNHWRFLDMVILVY